MASNSKVQSAVLAITLRAITGQLRRKAMALGEKGRIEPGAVTLIQRFGGSINPNIHWLSSRALASAVSREATFHMLVLEGCMRSEENTMGRGRGADGRGGRSGHQNVVDQDHPISHATRILREQRRGVGRGSSSPNGSRSCQRAWQPPSSTGSDWGQGLVRRSGVLGQWMNVTTRRQT